MATIRRSYPHDAAIGHWTAPDGWLLRRFDWRNPASKRGSLLFVTGRGDMFEKYLESFAHFQGAGWNVTSLDWRGQGGSGRLAPDPNCGHVDDFAVWISDIAAFWAQWRREYPGPHVMIGHSMGGHLLLRALVERRLDPLAAVLVAPMLGMNSGPIPASAGVRIARLMCLLGDPARQAWKNVEKPGVSPSLRQSLLTHSLERYEDELFWHGHEPSLCLGPPSWRWMDAAYRSIALLDAPGVLEEVATPLLMLAAEQDGLVDTRAILKAADRLPNCRLQVYGPEAAHEILREADPVRQDALQRIDAFFDENAPHP